MLTSTFSFHYSCLTSSLLLSLSIPSSPLLTVLHPWSLETDTSTVFIMCLSVSLASPVCSESLPGWSNPPLSWTPLLKVSGSHLPGQCQACCPSVTAELARTTRPITEQRRLKWSVMIKHEIRTLAANEAQHTSLLDFSLFNLKAVLPLHFWQMFIGDHPSVGVFSLIVQGLYLQYKCPRGFCFSSLALCKPK